MKIIEPRVELVNAPSYSDLLSLIELAGRTCYKSESKITEDSAEKFVRNILKRGHEAVIEHGSVTVRFTCDRGVSHEIVRHRLASYCQESTCYCNYSKESFGGEISFIRPSTMAKGSVGNASMDCGLQTGGVLLLCYARLRLYPAGGPVCSSQQHEDRGGHDGQYA